MLEEHGPAWLEGFQHAFGSISSDEGGCVTPGMKEHGRIGIELMTAKAEAGESADFLNERLQTLVQEHSDDGKHGKTGLIMAATGLSNVATVLIFMLREKTGQTEQEILQEVAQYFHTQN
jgi:hypothetical protein